MYNVFAVYPLTRVPALPYYSLPDERDVFATRSTANIVQDATGQFSQLVSGAAPGLSTTTLPTTRAVFVLVPEIVLDPIFSFVVQVRAWRGGQWSGTWALLFSEGVAETDPLVGVYYTPTQY